MSPTLNPPRLTEQAISAIAATPDGKFLYVGSGKSVFQFRAGADGVLVPLSPPAVPAEGPPQPLLMDPKGRFLYALSGFGNTLYAVGRDGRLIITPKIPAQDQAINQPENIMPPGRFAIDPSGTHLYGCNNGISGYRLDTLGRVIAPLKVEEREPQKTREGLTLGKQNNAVVLTPSGHLAFVLAGNYVGPPDKIYEKTEEVVLPMRVSPSGDLNLLPGAVTPRDAAGTPYYCTDLAVDQSGQVLFVVTPLLGAILPYRIGPEGALTAIPVTPHVGEPAKFFSVPGSPFLYILFQYPPLLQAFRVDSGKGLIPAGVDLPATEIPFSSNLAVGEAPTPAKLGPITGGLEASAYLPGSVLPTDKPVVLTFILKNVTHTPIRLGTTGADMTSFRLAVAGPQRESPGELRSGGDPVAGAVPLLSAGHDLFNAPGKGNTELVLSPGQQRQYRFFLSRLADLTVAGNYTIQISHILPGGIKVSSPVMFFRLDGPFNGSVRDDKYSVQIL